MVTLIDNAARPRHPEKANRPESIVLRKPVGDHRGSPARLAGVVLNLQPLLAESGINDPLMHGMRLAIRRPSGEVFFGSPAVFAQQPVLSRVSLAEGHWDMAAVPAPGWRASSDRPASA